jgi:hypothetical protein
MNDAFANQVAVESPTIQDGLRADHPRLRDYAMIAFAKGHGNEHVVRITGLPIELVTKYRHQFQKERSVTK